MIDPHKPIPWPMQVSPSNRGLDTQHDAILINGYQEKMPNGDVHTFKRPGIEFAAAGVIGTAKGAHGNIFVIDLNVYRLSDGFYYGAMAPYTYRMNCTFADMDYSGLYMFINNGDNGGFFIINGNTMTQIAGPSASIPMVPGVVYLNGTVYLMNIQGQIYGSNVGDPTTWNSLNVISTNVTASLGIALAKQKVYVVAFSRYAITVFYDAGNASGSPLRLLPGGQSGIGCYDANTIQTISDDLYWVGSPQTVGLAVYKMSDLKVTKISTPAIERLLSVAQYNINPLSISIPFPARSLQTAIHGHRFYILNLYNLGLSLVYDVDQGNWLTWRTANNAGALPYFTPLDYGSNMDTSNQAGGASIPLFNRFQNVNGAIYRMNPTVYQDLDGLFELTLRTDNFDAGDRVRKYLKRFDFLTDQVTGSTMTVSHTDDDFNTYSPPRTVDLSVPFPHLDNCGTFRRRAYIFRHAANTPFRLRGAIAHMIPGSL